MNTLNSIRVSAFFSMVAIVQVAKAVSRDEFCQDLTRLEFHMDAGLAAARPAGQGGYESSYDCTCVDPGANADGFAIDCEERSSDGEYFGSERMEFEPSGGEHSLVRTSWGEKDPASGRLDIPQEFYLFDDGALVGCKANGCTSCEVCDDGKSIAVDCGAHEGWNYAHACADGYGGSFSNSFDFGVITGEGRGRSDKDGFCQSLAELEAHMSDGLEKLMNMTFTSSYECACSEMAADNIFTVWRNESGVANGEFAVDCSMEGTTGAEAFASSERLVFQLNQGAYEISQASWSWKDSSVTWDSQETFFFENGAVASCEAAGCASCGLCGDGRSIEVDCSALEEFEYLAECEEGYTGAFVNTFDFGAILQSPGSSDTTSTSATLAGDAANATVAADPNTTSAAAENDAAGESQAATAAPSKLGRDDVLAKTMALAALAPAGTPREAEDEGQVEGRGDVVAGRAVSLDGTFWMSSSASCVASGFPWQGLLILVSAIL